MRKSMNTATVAWVLFVAVNGIHAVSIDIREALYSEINAGVSLEQFYYTHSNLYERRYFFQYVPEYIVRVDGEELPEWLINGLDEALRSPYCPLVVSAIECIGRLKGERFSNDVVDAFVTAPKRNAEDISTLRMAALQALESMGGYYVQSNLQTLFDYFSENFLLTPEFEKLMELTARFGDDSNMKSLDWFYDAAKEMADQHAEDRFYDDLTKRAELILWTKQITASGTDHD